MDDLIEQEAWWIFHGRVPREGDKTIADLPSPPPWRPGGADAGEWNDAWSATQQTTYRATARELLLINTALYLRRPLLVTGKPGTGKSTLAAAVAAELGLGPVLTWPVNTRSTLQDGLYTYDAIGRLRDASMAREAGGQGTARMPEIGEYLTLRPLGTALLPWKRPRVLLIDEIDKGDVDLPNDLLHVFESGKFEIPELGRTFAPQDAASPADQNAAIVHTADQGRKATIRGTWIQHQAFPLVIMTSNGERAFPPAFRRRCLELEIQPPNDEQLTRIVKAHFDGHVPEASVKLVAAFLARRGERGKLATDQLLNAVFLATQRIDIQDGGSLLDAVMKELGEG